MNPTLTVKLENDIGLHTSPGLHQDTSTKNDQNGKQVDDSFVRLC